MTRKLTAAQIDGLRWLYPDGSFRPWESAVPGAPGISAMQALTRSEFARKRGGDGFPVAFAITESGRSALTSGGGDES